MLVWWEVFGGLEGEAAAGAQGWTYPMVAVVFVLKKLLVDCRWCCGGKQRCLPGYKAIVCGCADDKRSRRGLSRQTRTLKENLTLSWWGLLGKSEGRRLHRI